MAKGIAIPFTVKGGRLQMLEGNDYVRQLLMTALGNCDSENPFRDLGLGEFMIFGINDQLSEGEIRKKIEQIFETFEVDQLAKIQDPKRDIRFYRNAEELFCEISYVDLESQERYEISVPVPGEM
jgi:hypothetical protein